MCRHIHIAISILLVIIESKTVTAIITINIQFISLIKRMRECSTDIIESSLAILVTTLFRQHTQQPITICSTSTKQ